MPLRKASTSFSYDISNKADLYSPSFTGIPTAPTAAPGTNTTQIATTQFIQAAIAALIDSSPATLDTLNELATALGNDPNFATTITNMLSTKANLTDLAIDTNLSPEAQDAIAKRHDQNADKGITANDVNNTYDKNGVLVGTGIVPANPTGNLEDAGYYVVTGTAKIRPFAAYRKRTSGLAMGKYAIDYGATLATIEWSDTEIRVYNISSVEIPLGDSKLAFIQGMP